MSQAIEETIREDTGPRPSELGSLGVSVPSRKRALPSSSTMLILPPKKHVDSVGGVDYSFHKGNYF